MRGVAILILCVLFFWLCWPAISRWLKRKAMERADSYLRNMMGMPPREKSNKKKTGNRAASEERSYYDTGSYYKKNNRSRNPSGHEPLIPKEYAEDVEFVETIDHSEKIHIKSETVNENYKESQISDAEFTEIKIKNTSFRKK